MEEAASQKFSDMLLSPETDFLPSQEKNMPLLHSAYLYAQSAKKIQSELRMMRAQDYYHILNEGGLKLNIEDFAHSLPIKITLNHLSTEKVNLQ